MPLDVPPISFGGLERHDPTGGANELRLRQGHDALESCDIPHRVSGLYNRGESPQTTRPEGPGTVSTAMGYDTLPHAAV